MDHDQISALLEFNLLTAASNYDLRNPAERRRSHDDLIALFYDIAEAVKPKLFVEAGAFNAQASRDIKSRLKKCRTVAFEANPYNFQLWTGRHDFQQMGIEYLHQALAETPGEITFKVQKARAGEELEKTTGRSSLLSRADPSYEYEDVTVPATSLDDFFSESTYTSMAWVDVEGACKPVLSGGSSFLRSCAAVFIEVEEKAIWDGQWLAGDVSNFMRASGLFPLARDFESRSRVQYNLIFLRHEYFSHPYVRAKYAEYCSRSRFGSSPIS